MHPRARHIKSLNRRLSSISSSSIIIPEDQLTIGVLDFTSSNYWKTSPGTGLIGGYPMMFALFCRLDWMDVQNQHLAGHGRRSSLGGWGFEHLTHPATGQPSIRFFMVDISGSIVTSHLHQWRDEDVGKMHCLLAKSGNTILQFYVNGAKVGSNITHSGYIVTPDSSLSTSIGARDDGSSVCHAYTITGLAGTSISQFSFDARVSELSTGYSDICLSEAKIYPQQFEVVTGVLPAVTDYMWIGEDVDGLPSTWVDTIAGLELNRQGTGGGQDSFVAQTNGNVIFNPVGGFTTSNYYIANAANTAPVGSDAMSVAIICRRNGTFPNNGVIFGHSDGTAASGGWGFQVTSGQSIRFFIVDSTDTIVFSQSYDFIGADLYLTFTAVATYDGSEIKFYIDAEEMGSPIPASGYKSPSSSLSTTIGAYSNATVASTQIYVLAALSATEVMSSTDVSDWHNSFIKDHVVSELSGVTNETRWWQNGGSSVPSQLVDEVSGLVLNKVGTDIGTLTYTPRWRT